VSERRDDVDPIIGDAVGSQLKALFDEFAQDAVPDRFMKLIEQLEAVEAAEASASGTSPHGHADKDAFE
jgi:hypothetical protein